jgi:hypothetical protein
MKNWLLSLFRSDWDYHYNGTEQVMRRWKDGAYETRPMTAAEELNVREWQSVK